MLDIVDFTKELKACLSKKCETSVDIEKKLLEVKCDDVVTGYNLDNVRTTEDIEELKQEIIDDFTRQNKHVYKLKVEFLDETMITVQVTICREERNIDFMRCLFQEETVILQDAEQEKMFWFIKTKEIECVTVLEVLENEEDLL